MIITKLIFNNYIIIPLVDFVKKNGEINIEDNKQRGSGYNKALSFVAQDNIRINASFSRTIGELEKETIEEYSRYLYVNHYKGSIYELDIHNASLNKEDTVQFNGKYCTLRITCNQREVKDAIVSLDGNIMGQMPVFMDEVKAGVHIIKVVADNYDNYVAILELKEGEETSLCVNLRRETFVDLGLSVKWASCNLGASDPLDVGDYYAWGEIKPKETYRLESYIFQKEIGSLFKRHIMSKYNVGYSSDISDGKNQLELSDDAAHIKMGLEWRIPTFAEAKELINNCRWHPIIKAGAIVGYKIVSNINDRSIIVPVSGVKKGIIIENGIDDSYFWTSILDDYSCNCAMLVKNGGWSNGLRYYGLPIRPVCP